MITLLDFNKKHIDKTFEWIQDPELRRSFLMRQGASYDNHIKYFQNTLKNHTQKVYAISYNSQHAGNCGIKHLNAIERSAETWIYIGEASLKKKGIGDAALKLLLKKCFDDMKLKKVYLHVADFNAPAIRLYEKNGFIRTDLEYDSGEWASRGCKIFRLELGRERWT